MNAARRPVLACIGVAALAPMRVGAERAGRLPRVALVFNAVPLAEMAGAEPAHPFARAFVVGLREQGLVDGRDIIIERRTAEGRPERMAALMRELVVLGVDVIVTTGPGVHAAQRATDRIAIVALPGTFDSDLVANLARPGGNLTGIGVHSQEIFAKELQLLKEALPEVQRVAVIDNRVAQVRNRALRRDALEGAARALQLQLLWLHADVPEELDTAFAAIVRERPEALYAVGTTVNFGERRRIADFAMRQRLPLLGFPEEGGLLDYGSEMTDELRRAAVYVKKILDGAKPGDLPVEQPTRFTLTLNLRTAKALGVTIPQSLRLRADKVIE
jgi:putative ABC transport system substrate-binding protein